MTNRYSYIHDTSITQVPEACYRVLEALVDLWQRGERYISVRMLTDEAEIDRLEFYEYYEGIEDVEEQMENLLIGYLLELGDDDYLEHTMSWIGENRKWISYLINEKKSGSFYLKWRDAIRYHLVNWGIVDDTQDNLFIVAGISGLIISIFTLNISEKHDVDLGNLEERISDISNILYDRSKTKKVW